MVVRIRIIVENKDNFEKAFNKIKDSGSYIDSIRSFIFKVCTKSN
jgi:hypothetical protein